MNSLRIRLGCPTQRSIQLGCCGGFHSRGLSFLRRFQPVSSTALEAFNAQQTQQTKHLGGSLPLKKLLLPLAFCLLGPPTLGDAFGKKRTCPPLCHCTMETSHINNVLMGNMDRLVQHAIYIHSPFGSSCGDNPSIKQPTSENRTFINVFEQLMA